jgi:uncharacterized protein involved in cysteine biosynthesis
MGVFSAILLAIQQLSAPEFRRVLARAISLSVITFIALAVGVQWALVHWGLAAMPWIGTLIQFLGGFATLGLAWVLFPAVATFMVGFFVEDISEATEIAHYGDDPPGQSPDFFSGLLSSAWFLTVAVGVNILAIPIYLLLLLFPPLLPVAFYGINGYLLGREYFELAAHRHMHPADARALRHENRWRIWAMGAGVAFLFTVPIVNLAAPVIAAAAMVHVFKFISGSPEALD